MRCRIFSVSNSLHSKSNVETAPLHPFEGVRLFLLKHGNPRSSQNISWASCFNSFLQAPSFFKDSIFRIWERKLVPCASQQVGLHKADLLLKCFREGGKITALDQDFKFIAETLQLFPLLYTSGMEDEVRTIICLSVDSHFRGPHGEEIWRAIWSCSNWANMARACRIESHGRKKLEAIVLLLICWQMRQKGCKINVNLKENDATHCKHDLCLAVLSRDVQTEATKAGRN